MSTNPLTVKKRGLIITEKSPQSAKKAGVISKNELIARFEHALAVEMIHILEKRG